MTSDVVRGRPALARPSSLYNISRVPYFDLDEPKRIVFFVFDKIIIDRSTEMFGRIVS